MVIVGICIRIFRNDRDNRLFWVDPDNEIADIITSADQVYDIVYPDGGYSYCRMGIVRVGPEGTGKYYFIKLSNEIYTAIESIIFDIYECLGGWKCYRVNFFYEYEPKKKPFLKNPWEVFDFHKTMCSALKEKPPLRYDIEPFAGPEYPDELSEQYYPELDPIEIDREIGRQPANLDKYKLV